MISKCRTASGVYLSIDLDCLDSGVAPGVSVPEAAGLMLLELIFLVKKACSNLPIVGLDLVELCPGYDVNHNTVNIAAKLLKETIASIVILVNGKNRIGSKKSRHYHCWIGISTICTPTPQISFILLKIPFPLFPTFF